MNKIPIPAFLKKIDRYLLEHYPLLWTVKLHYVLSIALLALIPAGLLVAIKPISPTDLPSPEGWFVTLLIPMSLIFAGFALFQIIFTGRRHFGRESFRADYVRQLLTFCAGVILLSVPWLTSTMLVGKANHNLRQKEVFEDLNDLNRGVKFFYGFQRYYNYEEHEFPLPKLNYEYEAFQIYGFEHPEILSGEELLALDKPTDSYEQLEQELGAFMTAFQRWGGELPEYSADEIIKNYRKGMTNENFQVVWDDSEVFGNLYDWGEVYRWESGIFQMDFLGVALFVLFIITILILILQSISLKHFLVSIVVGFLMIPLTVLLMEGARMSGGYGVSEEMGLSLLWMYIIFAGGVTISVFSSQKFSGFKTVVATLFNSVIPFIPLLTVASLDEFNFIYTSLSDNDVIGLLWMGAGLYLLVGIPLMTGVYRKLHALPRG